MSRKKDYFDNGSIGVSQKALQALKSGTYGKETGRTRTYRTSEEQTQQVKDLPVLKGIDTTSETKWESSFGKNKTNGIDTVGPRKRYAERNQIQESTKSTDDRNYKIKRDLYDKLMQDTRLASDIKTLAEVNYKNANQDATVSQEWADEYGAKHITGGMNKKDFINTLSRRYSLTPAELNDMALTFHSDANKAENETYKNDLAEAAKIHPIIGSTASLIGTLGSGVEGAYNAVVGGVTGDDRYLSNTFSSTKEGLREGAKENIKSNAGKTAYDLGMGVADMATGAAAGSAPLFLAGNAANDAMSSAIDKGSSVRKSAAYGAGAGVLDYITNTIGLDKAKKLAVDSIKSTGIKKFLAQNAAAGLGEAGENVIQDIGQSLIDNLINGENSELQSSYNDKIAIGMSDDDALKAVAKEYAGQLGMSGLLGFGMGSAMQAGATALPKIPQLVADKWTDAKMGRLGIVDPDIRNILDDVEPMSQSEITPTDVKSPRTMGDTDDMRLTDEEIANTNRMNAEDTSREFSSKPSEGVTRTNPSSLPNDGDVSLLPEGTKSDISPEEFEMRRVEYAQKKGYSDEEIADAKQTFENIKKQTKSLVNMFNEDALPIQQKIVADIDRYLETGNIEDYARFFDDMTELDEALNNGHPYTYKRMYKSKNKSAGPQSVEYANYQGKNGRIPDMFDFLQGTYNDNGKSPADALFYREDALRQVAEQPAPANVTEQETPNLAEIPTTPEMDTSPNESTNPTPDLDVPESGEEGISRVVTNSAANAGIVTQEEIDSDPVLQEIAKYAKHNNELTYGQAQNNVSKHGDTLLAEYNSGQREINSDLDVDQAMIMLRSLKSQIAELGDNAPEDLIAKKNLLLSQLRKAGTRYGETIQAFAKWNDTADGAIINAERILSETEKVWSSRNQGQVEQNKKIAKELSSKWLDKKLNTKIKNALNSLVEEDVKPEKEPLSFDEVRESVMNTIEQESASLADFTDEEIDYVTYLIMNGASTQEIATALNTKMATGRFALSGEAQTKINRLFEVAEKNDPNSRIACEAKAAAYKLAADEVVGDASPFEKFETWRFLAMLGNPKTMIRNMVGNTMFNALTSFSNTLSAAIEGGVDKTSRAFGGEGIQRRKAILSPSKDYDLISGAWADADNKSYGLLAGAKYEKGNLKDKIRSEKSVYKSKAMRGFENAVDIGISDYPAVRTKYSTSLAGYMKANGLTKEAFNAESSYLKLQKEGQLRVLTDAEKAKMADLKETMDVLQKGRDYAIKQAEYAAFHEDNAIADFLSKASSKARNNDKASVRALGYMLEGVIPFKKTPANILKSGLEYSPLGAIKSIAETGKLIYENTGKRKSDLGETYTKENKFTGKSKEVERSLASDVIESWSKTLTGTGLVALGYYLHSKGVLNSSNTDEKYQDELEGRQNYSITINGKTYTIDWAVPASMPILVGAEIDKIMSRNNLLTQSFYENIDDIVNSVNTLFGPVVETSMLQGLQNSLESAANQVKYNDDGAFLGILGSVAATAGSGYFTQAIPTISGQIARTVDPTRRATDTSANSAFLSGIEKQGRKIMNKIPFLSYLNPEYRDARGQTQANSPTSNPLGALAYQMLSPAYVADINTTAADQMARDVFNAKDKAGNRIADNSVFPQWKSSVKVDGQKLDPKQMSLYRQASGEANEAIRDALTKEEWFSTLGAQEQADILKKINTLVDKVGKEAAGYPQSGKELEAYKEGIPSLFDTFHDTAINTTIKAETNLSTSSNAAKIIKADIVAGNTQAAEQKIDEAAQLSNLGFTKPGPTETYYKAKEFNPDLSVEEFARLYKQLDTDGNQGIKQDELIDFFNANHYTSEQKALDIWSMFAPNGKKLPYLKDDGTWGKH